MIQSVVEGVKRAVERKLVIDVIRQNLQFVRSFVDII